MYEHIITKLYSNKRLVITQMRKITEEMHSNTALNQDIADPTTHRFFKHVAVLRKELIDSYQSKEQFMTQRIENTEHQYAILVEKSRSILKAFLASRTKSDIAVEYENCKALAKELDNIDEKLKEEKNKEPSILKEKVNELETKLTNLKQDEILQAENYQEIVSNLQAKFAKLCASNEQPTKTRLEQPTIMEEQMQKMINEISSLKDHSPSQKFIQALQDERNELSRKVQIVC